MSRNLDSVTANNSFFDGYYKEIWKQVFPEKTTIAEVDFIISESQLNKNSQVLDLMCGYGRHALELAKRGLKVVAVDNLPDYIEEIKEKAAVLGLNIECICDDVLEIRPAGQFDAVICMGNSLQFFDQENILQLLSTINSHLNKGGKFFINTWSIAEIVFKNFKEKNWSKVGDLLFFAESKLSFQPTRVETLSTIITESGEKEEKNMVEYIFSLGELGSMLNKTGFLLNAVYSIPGQKYFSLGDARAYIVAEKI